MSTKLFVGSLPWSVNDQKLSKGTKGDLVTIPLGFRIRPSDKLYKIVENKVEA